MSYHPRKKGQKQWLGGYRHKTKETVFHHAVAQTNRQVTKHAPQRNSRDTQTTFKRQACAFFDFRKTRDNFKNIEISNGTYTAKR